MLKGHPYSPNVNQYVFFYQTKADRELYDEFESESLDE